MRAGRWPVAPPGVPHGGVDGRAWGVRSVQVGQQRAHVQGVGVSDEDLTEDRGVGGKLYAMPGRGGGEEREDARGPRRGGEHDVGRVRPRERYRGERDHRTAVYCEVPSGTVVEEPDEAMLWRGVWGWVLGGVGACGGRGGGRGGGVGGGTAEE